jgi:hypothetical protein
MSLCARALSSAAAFFSFFSWALAANKKEISLTEQEKRFDANRLP